MGRFRHRSRSHAIAACALALALAMFAPSRARAADEGERRAMSQEELEKWLSSEQEPKDVGGGAEPEEAPPPPPRHHGLTVESSIGALGYLGTLKNVTPTSPWFHLQLGYEFSFVQVFGEADLVFSNTSYANPPPEPRTFALYGGGGGLRGTLKLSEYFGLYVQGSLGFARVNDDVLFIYGYRDADRWHLYYGAELGLEWYQVNPHMSLAVHGGVRDYSEGLSRERSSGGGLAWISGVSLRYVF